MQAIQDGRVPLRPGVERLLREARSEGLTLAIATTTTPVNVQSLIENTIGAKALDWFAVIGAGDCVENLKPAPAACLAFEDSANGLKAATAAGLGTLVSYCPYTKDHDFSGALDVLGSLGAVDVAFLRALQGRL